LTDPLPKSKDDTLPQGSFDGGGGGDAMSNTMRMKKKKLGPDVLVPCRYEDVNTLTALLPPLPLRSVYLNASNKRSKPKGGVEKWPKPWPSIACFQVDVVMASDDAKLLKLWETKLANGVEAPLVAATSSSSNNNNNSNNNNSGGNNDNALVTTTTNEELTSIDHLKVYSLPGMTAANQGMPSFTLNVGSGGCGAGKMVEIVMVDAKFTLFEAKNCLVRFAFTNKEGTKFIRDSKKSNKATSSPVVAAQAALNAAQALPQTEDEAGDDAETLQHKATARQERLDKIARCEEELAAAVSEATSLDAQEDTASSSSSSSSQAASTSNNGNSGSKKCDWFVDVPAIVEEVSYLPETPKVASEKKNKKNSNNAANQPKRRWVIRCRAPGLKKKNIPGGSVEFDTSQPSLSAMNNNIIQALSANQNASRRRKSYKETDAKDLANQIAQVATFGETVPPATSSQFTRTYARVFVSLNGTHFHDWPTNALTNGEPPAPYEDNKNAATAAAATAGGVGGAPVENTQPSVEPPPVTSTTV
jgi:hypothetical protein